MEMLKEIFPDKTYLSTPMKKEVDRCRLAVEKAMEGIEVAMVSSGDSGIYGMAGIVLQVAEEMQADIDIEVIPGVTAASAAAAIEVAMVSSGDSGIYGMAGIVLQVAEEMQADIDIEVIPGVTAASAAAAVLGAPLMHDTALISLSDLMTPLDLIMKRVDCAGQSDFVICLYNPKSKKRTEYVGMAADILLKYRSADTPVGIVRHAGRSQETSCLTTLGELKSADIDMFSIVVIGNSQTYVKHGKMITPRGYRL